MKVNIITNAGPVAQVPGGIYEGLDYHGEPPWGVSMRAGWRLFDGPQPIPQPGYTSKAHYSQDPERPDYAAVKYVYAPIPIPEPDPRDVEIASLKARMNKVEGDVAKINGREVPK